MVNAKEEFLSMVRGLVVVAVAIYISTEIIEEDKDSNVLLKQGHTEQEFEAMLASLDFEYDDGFGCQYLFGTVWFDDGTWSERAEYDGSEWWNYIYRPDIPSHLLAEDFPPAPPTLCYVL